VSSAKTNLPMRSIAGLELLEEIGRGAFSVVYRARHNGTDYALKIAHEKDVAGMGLTFRREAAALARLRHKNLPLVKAIGESDGWPYLVMELLEGQNLKDLLEHRIFNETEVIRMGRCLCEVLDEIHRHGLIHRDIKPQNILIDGSGEAKLIDLGLSWDLGAQKINPQFSGTFLYSSPEQLGLIDQPIDARSDLYALGVVLFEMATGKKPFNSNNLGDFIERHLATRPPMAHEVNAKVSQSLSEVLIRLLAPDPDDRQQSASELLQDLARIQAPELGDVRQSPLLDRVYDPPLIGRPDEFRRLSEGWSQTLQGRGSVMVISGEPGKGKSRLARELIKEVRTKPALILRSKCSKENPTPLAPLREAIDGFLHQLRREPSEVRAAAHEKLRKAMGAWAPVLKNLSPGLLALYPGSQATALSDDNQEKFQTAVADFFLNLSEAECPVLLCIDDMQWADPLTRRVLTHLVSSLGNAPLMVLFTSRNDAESQRSLDPFMAQIQSDNLIQIELGPLGRESILGLIQIQLGEYDMAENLISEIHNRSQGNPFAVGELVRSLLEQGALKLLWGHWELDAEALKTVQLPSDLIELVVSRTRELSTAAQEILAVAAIIGAPFKMDFLKEVCGTNEAVIRAAVQEGIRASLIELGEDQTYTFVHDRVHEAFLSQMSEERLRNYHQRAAEILDLNTEVDQKNVYAIARHYTRGQMHLHPDRVYRANLAAGQKALANYAEVEAHAFLQEALSCAEIFRLGKTAELEDALGEACFRLNEVDKSISHLKSALSLTQDATLSANLYYRISRAYMARIRPVEAWEEVNKGLRAIDLPTLEMNLFEWIGTIVAWLMAIFFGKLRFIYQTNSARTRARIKIGIELYKHAGYVAFYNHRALLMVPAALRVLSMGSRLGPSRELVIAYAGYSTVAYSVRLPYFGRKYAEKARTLALQLEDHIALGEARALEGHGIAFEGSKDHEAMRMYMDLWHNYGKWLSKDDFVNVGTAAAWMYQSMGQCKEAAQMADELYSRLKLGASHVQPNDPTRLFALSLKFACANLMGRETEAMDVLKSYEEVTPANIYNQVQVRALTLAGYIEKGDFGAKFEDLNEKLDGVRIRPVVDSHFQRHTFVYQVHGRLKQYFSASADAKSQHLVKLKIALKNLRAACDRPFFKAHYLIAKGALLTIEGKVRSAFATFDKAEKICRDTDNPWALFELNKHKALLFKQIGRTEAALDVASAARSLALRQGAVSRARDIERTFNLVEREPTSAASANSAPANLSYLRLERHLSALLNVSLASSSLLDPIQQVKSALDEIIRILRAERGLLFLQTSESDPTLKLTAARTFEGQDLGMIEDFSKTIIENVRVGRKPVLLHGHEDSGLLQAQSIVAHNLRSIIATPITIQQDFKGVLYLDNRLAKGVFTGEDLDILQAIGNHIGISFHAAKTVEREFERREMKKDLEVARVVQTLLLPSSLEVETPHLSLAAHYESAAQTAGDWWWCTEKPDGRLLVLVGDATGHGAGAAMVSAAVAGSYRTIEQLDSSEEILEILNQSIAKVCRGEYWMTMSLLEINPKSRSFKWMSAGSPPAFILRSNQSVEALAGPSTPLGAGDKVSAFKASGDFNSGDRFMLCGDGVIEQPTRSGGQVGLKRLQNQLQKTQGLQTRSARDEVVAWFNALKEPPVRDDLTFVIVDAKT
jgi:eukaryotic-like serine/threonine-protein kinase